MPDAIITSSHAVEVDYSKHEALHMAHVFQEMVENYLLYHPAVKANHKWFELADAANTALAELYQEIGRETLWTGTRS